MKRHKLLRLLIAVSVVLGAVGVIFAMALLKLFGIPISVYVISAVIIAIPTAMIYEALE